MRDTECGGSVMNMSWATWRNTYGLDMVASGSVASASSDLVGSGALTRLPPGDPRLSTLGHRYPLRDSASESIFADSFEQERHDARPQGLLVATTPDPRRRQCADSRSVCSTRG